MDKKTADAVGKVLGVLFLLAVLYVFALFLYWITVKLT